MDERKSAILRAVVREYIRTAQPVGSAALAPALGVSSATVRNEMSALEEMGYLFQPHTSSGRVPAEKGYRFFVDSLGEPPGLPPAMDRKVRDFFDRAHGELEVLLQETSALLADLTRYTAVVVGPEREVATVRSLQLVDLGGSSVLVVVVLSDGRVEKRVVERAGRISEVVLHAASVHLARHLEGARLGDLPKVPRSGDRRVDALVERVLSGLRSGQAPSSDVYVEGRELVASFFDTLETVRKVLETLREQYVVVTLLRDLLTEGRRVAIGSEMGVEPLTECSVVLAPFEVGGEVKGALGILGPTRMDYAQALGTVTTVSKRLAGRLSLRGAG